MIDLNLCNRQQIQALLRLKEDGNSALVPLLEELVEAAKARLVIATDMVNIHRLQGRAEAFEDFLRAIEESPKVTNRS
jgi:hypothetical protein|tara:strand:+ start:1447 stop:1680 length:234 start_codon:yes stop_codon:yes gene_type:complete